MTATRSAGASEEEIVSTPSLLDDEGPPPVADPGRSPRSWGRMLSGRVAMAAWRALIVVGVLLAWEALVNAEVVNRTYFSQPSAIWAGYNELVEGGQLARHAWASAKAALIGFAIGTIVGTAAGFALGLSSFTDRLLGPLLVPINSVPRIALAPIFIVWFGLGTESKVWLAVSIIFFVLLFNTRAAVKSIDPDLIMLSQVAGLNRLQYIAKIAFPASVPAIFAGIRLAITYSLLGVISSEMVASKDGLGQNLVTYTNTLRIDLIFATLALIALAATLVNSLVEAVERRLLKWQ